MELKSIDLYIFLAIAVTAFLAYKFKKIDRPGALVGVVMAFIIWKGGGATSLLSLFMFFVLGSLVSSLGKDFKVSHHLEQDRQGKRGVNNVMANGGIALIFSLSAIVYSLHQGVLGLMIVSSFAGACSDTFSSELGNLYGKKYFTIISFRSAKRGLDGVISLAGLAFGLLGSLLIAIAVLPFLDDPSYMIIITTAGLGGNLVDSVLGATLQQKGYLDNHQVNFFATLSSSLLALAMLQI